MTNGEPQKEIDATLQAAGVKLPKSAKKCYQVIDLLSGHDAEGWVVPRPPGQSERGMIVSRGSTKMRSHKSQHVDAPVLESTLTDDEVIAVVDPTHPLHGRSFPILRLCQAIHGQGFVEVRYRQSLRLRIPLAATDRATSPLSFPRTKLTLEAIQQLILLVKECQSSCPNSPTASASDCPTT